ncbi:MAG TPA: hypothetical protein VGC22_13765 [Chitinophaga sp.]
MMKIHDLRVGDTVVAQYDGVLKQGVVTGLNHDEKQISVVTDEQEFWYNQEDLFPVSLGEEQLAALKFVRNNSVTQGAQYERGPFIIRFYVQNGEKHVDLQYRDEIRELKGDLTVSTLQNHYAAMTNFHLD